MPQTELSLRRLVKAVLNCTAMVVMSPVALCCWPERAWRFESTPFFSFWAQVVALLPGPPGRFLRRAFYRWTLERCEADVTIEFGTLFSRPSSILESGVYIGSYALIGSAWIQQNSLIGSRVSLLSGGQQHRMLPSGQWSATESKRLPRIVIGRSSWIGEGAVVMVDTGEGSMIAAGAVVSSAVPDRVMVAGNPARFVQRVTVPDDAAEPERATGKTIAVLL
jgi:virginiamycin A acetyltransferase